jgi:hypothetical protein
LQKEREIKMKKKLKPVLYCSLGKKICLYGGTKYYNYDFSQGTAGYCFYIKKFTSDLNACPVEEENKED